MNGARTISLRLSSRQLEDNLEECKVKAEGALPPRAEGTSVHQMEVGGTGMHTVEVEVEKATVHELEMEATLVSRGEVDTEDINPFQSPKIQMIRYSMPRMRSIHDTNKVDKPNMNLRTNDNQVLLPPYKVHLKSHSALTAQSDPITHPKGDNRWPPPSNPVNRPIYLLGKYWYRLIHDNPDPEVSQLCKDTITRVTSAWQRYKKNRSPTTTHGYS
jgi:hypothetical protein